MADSAGTTTLPSPTSAGDPKSDRGGTAFPPSTWERLDRALAELGGLGSLLRFEPGAGHDASHKFEIRDRHGRPNGFLLESPSHDPSVIAHAVEQAARARALLGPSLGGVILPPLDTGHSSGRSYALFPYRSQIPRGWRGRWRRWRLRAPLLEWLRRATEVTRRRANQIEQLAQIRTDLEIIRDHHELGDAVRTDAERALARLDRDWQPVQVLCHGDLWLHNILLPARGDHNDYPFVLIDWPGARLDGYPIYDLVRLLGSIRCSRRLRRRELLQHCRILGCARDDAAGYLLGALGQLRRHLGMFPEPRWIALTHGCHRWLRDALG